MRSGKITAVLGTLSFVALATLALGSGLRGLYERSIPAWAMEEQYRQATYRLYNDGRTEPYQGERYRMEFDLTAAGLPVDKDLIDLPKLANMKQESLATDPPILIPGQHAIHWFFVNERSYLLVAGLVALAIILSGSSFWIPAIGLGLATAGLWALGYWARTPEYLVIGALFLWTLMSCRHSADRLSVRASKWPLALMGLLLLIWGGIRIHKISTKHDVEREKFLATQRYITMNSDHLFIKVHGGLPVIHMPILADPRVHPLINYLSSEHFLMNMEGPAFKAFSLSGFPDVPHSDRVIFIGAPMKGLLDYFRYKGYTVTTKDISSPGCTSMFHLIDLPTR